MSALSVLYLSFVFSIAACLPASNDERSNRIVNGQAIDITRVPYHAALRRKTTGGWAYTCGAAIISDRALLTAAHCVKSIETQPSSIIVAVGTSERLSGGDTYEISTIYAHEDYSSITLQNDIALLVTSTKISFDESVEAALVPTSDINIPVGNSALVSGFGLTSEDGSVSSVLRATNVDIVSQTACIRAYRRIAMITSGMLCAFADNPPRDACQGDSGGPLVTNTTLIGIVSWGEGCANETYPGVYTRVSAYHPWIISKLNLIL